MRKQICKILLLTILLLCGSCNERAVEPDEEFSYEFLKGDLLSGTDYFFPLQFYDYLPAHPEVSQNSDEILYSRFYELPRDSTGVYRYNLRTGEKHLIVQRGYNATWSPDEQWIAFNIYPQIYKIKTNGDSLIRLTNGEGSFQPSWSPDGKRIGFYGGGGNIMNSDGTELGCVGPGFGGIADWHPSGEKVIFDPPNSAGQTTSGLKVFNLRTNQTEQVLDFPSKEAELVRFSPDGSRICLSSDNGIYVANSDGSNMKRILPRYVQNGYGYISGEQLGFLAISSSWYPDGRHIIYEGFLITQLWRARPDEFSGPGLLLEGVLGFYKLNVDSALAVSTLPN